MIWLASLVIAGPAALLAAIALDSGWMLAVVLVALVAIPTVAIGWTFDHRGSLQNALSTAAMGTSALMVEYVFAMALSEGPGADDAAAIGVIIFVLPTFMAIASLMGLGFGLSKLLRRGSRRPSARPDVA
jgi:hypothetical protein